MRRLGSVLTVALLVFAALLVLLAVFARSDGRGITRVSGHPVLTVLSQSMTPTFRAGDLVIDEPVTPSQAERLVAGDVITFRLGDGNDLVTHRIVQVHSSASGDVTYTTKGDANNIVDSHPVEPSQIVGTYSRRIPLAGYALKAAHSRSGLFLFIFLPILALVGGEIAKRWRTSDDDAAAKSATDPGPAEIAQQALVGSSAADTSRR